MTSRSSRNELLTLRKHAEMLASERRESLSTAHLLAAIADQTSPAADLLYDWRLDVDTLRQMARASSKESGDLVGTSIRRARNIATENGAMTPVAVHLLIAVLRDARSAGYRALKQAGSDPQRLRKAALEVAQGQARPRRVSALLVPREHRTSHHSSHEQENSPVSTPSAAKRSATRKPAVPVPVMVAPHPRPDSAPPSTGRRPSTKAPRVAPEPAKEKSRRKPPTKRVNRSAGRPSKPAPEGEAFALSTKAYPVLQSVGINLTLAAAQGKLEPLVGRAPQIERVLDTLAKRRANNPCLVGPVGVGKRSIVRGVAHWTASDHNERGPRHILLELPLAGWFSGVQGRGALVERLDKICQEVAKGPQRIILFVDSAEILFAPDASDVIAPLKAALTAGKLPMITTTTPSVVHGLMEADAVMARAFDWLDIDEPDAEEAVQMVDAQRASLQEHHGLPLQDAAVVSSVEWSMRYAHHAALPEQAISVLDLACARAKRRGASEVTEQAVADVIADIAQMPVERLLETDKARMLNLENLLAERVVGHTAQLAQVATILKRNAAGLKGNRPVGSFLLLGPTGVGKTETAKSIAACLFHSPDAMTRFDMSEFSEAHAVARLIGAPPGYVGHEAGGQLTEAVKRRPYQVLLLDEFEKAHRDVQQAFLQVLDEGRMTDGRGRTVDFSNAVIVMTSNLGAAAAQHVSETRSIGFGQSRGTRSNHGDMKTAVIEAARAQLPPELYNRIDEVMFFEPLDRQEVMEIARRQLTALSERLGAARDIHIGWTDDGLEALLNQGGYEPSLGARPVKRAISRLVEAPIAELVLRDQVDREQTVLVTSDEAGRVSLEVVTDAASGQ